MSDDEGGGAPEDDVDSPDEGSERYRNLVETSPVPINVFDETGETLYGNDAVLELLGLEDRDELVGRSIFEFVHPRHRDVAERELRAVVEEKRSVGPTQMDIVRADGEVRHVQVATAPGRYDGQDVGQAVAVDLTHVQAVEGALDEERRFIQDALDTLPDVFFYIAADGVIERWNDTALQVSGYGPEEFTEMDVEDLFSPGDTERVLEAIGTAISTGSATVEADLQTADGRSVPFEFRGQRLLDADGDLRGVVGIGRDVTERRARTRQLRTIDRLLRHNLRNAITTIDGRAEQIQNEGDESLAHAASVILRTTERLMAAADKQREIVRLLADPPETRRIDISAIIEDAVDDARERFPAATIRVTAPAGLEARAVTGFWTAITELLENAIVHAGRSQPSVFVTVRRTDGSVTVAVEDECPPIPDVEVGAVMADEPERDQLSHGRGIGLWLVQLVVQQSRGSLDVEPATDRGNTVRIRLPAA